MAKPRAKKLITFMVWVGIITYLSFAMPYSKQMRTKSAIKQINIIIDDSLDNGFITKNEIKKVLENSDFQLIDSLITKTPLQKIEDLIENQIFVKQAEAFTNLEGILSLEITARKPIMRFNCMGRKGFYLTEDNYVLPLSNNFVSHVPIITGEIDFPFENDFVGYFHENDEKKSKKDQKNYEFVCNLANFVKFIRNDKFWDAQIVQIVVKKSSKGSDISKAEADFDYHIELVTRAGDGRIKLSSLDRYEQKLNKLMIFYHKALSKTGWNGIRYIDLSYDGQIVVSSK